MGAAAATLAAIAAPTAAACQCVSPGYPEVEVEVARAKGAFVGVYLGRRPLRPAGKPWRFGDPLIYKFRVERVVKGTFARTTEVVSAGGVYSCGLEVVKGRRYALLLTRDRGRWVASRCSQHDPSYFRGLPSRRPTCP